MTPPTIKILFLHTQKINYPIGEICRKYDVIELEGGGKEGYHFIQVRQLAQRKKNYRIFMMHCKNVYSRTWTFYSITLFHVYYINAVKVDLQALINKDSKCEQQLAEFLAIMAANLNSKHLSRKFHNNRS